MDLQHFEFDVVDTFRYSGDFEITVMNCHQLKGETRVGRLPFILTVRELDSGMYSGELTFSYNGDTAIHWIDDMTEDGFFSHAHGLVDAYINDGFVALR